MHLNNLAIAALLLGLVACNKAGLVPVTSTEHPTSEPAVASATVLAPQSTATYLPTPVPSRLLSICLVQEPRSLFLYDAVSTSERGVLAAIYDGPIDINNFVEQPVILERLPSASNGEAVLEAVQVEAGDLILDAQENLRNLGEGVVYRPSGCSELECAQAYSGSEPVQMDQLKLRFKLLPGLQWSDGSPLTAQDSVYSYEVARSLYSASLPERVGRTASYTAVDELTVEWVGVPGLVDGLYSARFFSPLPQHAWASLPAAELPGAEISSRKPLGWGAYIIDEWVAGDHISLHANPLYFQANKGLPYFDHLVYRFINDRNEAQAAVLAGECDLVSPNAGLETQTSSLLQLQDEGKVSLMFQTVYAWDLLAFDLAPLAEDHPPYFAKREVRQAVAMCIDRQALADQDAGGLLQVADSFVPAAHPLYNEEAPHYAFDPQAASELLTVSGWIDEDNDPSTPRIAQGVEGVADGTSFTVQYLVSNDAERQAAAKLIQADLVRCGIQAEISALPIEEYLAAGPDGPVFGRQFDLAQLAWITVVEPPCSLYLTSEIPGLYPEAPKGWGGVNAGGYSNPQYDQACLDALNSLPDSTQRIEKHAEAQAIFAEDLPALPLYWRSRVVLARPDLCGISKEIVADNILSGLELFNYGESCP